MFRGLDRHSFSWPLIISFSFPPEKWRFIKHYKIRRKFRKVQKVLDGFGQVELKQVEAISLDSYWQRADVQPITDYDAGRWCAPDDNMLPKVSGSKDLAAFTKI